MLTTTRNRLANYLCRCNHHWVNHLGWLLVTEEYLVVMLAQPNH